METYPVYWPQFLHCHDGEIECLERFNLAERFGQSNIFYSRKISKMKYLITSLSLLLIYTSLLSQTLYADSASQSNALKQGTLMAKLLLKKDYRSFTAFTYAPIIKMAGGLDKMASYMEESFKGMEDEGFSIANVTVENCSKIIHLEKQLQCTLTEIVELKHTDGKLIQKSTLIGIYSDKGVTWTFIDTHGATLKKLQETIKELSNDLVVPEQQEPEIISN
ncbi:hypothetical protein QWZ08_15525 [Ferruginibacter paludis]|uniref:hypothetical protein n=1 Tax=Ferruginibacter paludis TaxID=1310417 RepID=UPI0025B526E5|nr:hypothetical protein [Ferruginibacter paludis]MDN3657059.1 hypothetical protein [Ferruginibacter paludis]